VPTNLNTQRIPPEVLAEQWYSFLHSMIAGMQAAYRNAQLATPGLNQQVIAERIGKKASFVSRCLSGQQNMTARTIHDISRGMGYRPEMLFQSLGQLAPVNRKSGQLVEAHTPPATGVEKLKLFGDQSPATAGNRVLLREHV
jgi:plasmid maintenance system antidote protein VapI